RSGETGKIGRASNRQGQRQKNPLAGWGPRGPPGGFLLPENASGLCANLREGPNPPLSIPYPSGCRRHLRTTKACCCRGQRRRLARTAPYSLPASLPSATDHLPSAWIVRWPASVDRLAHGGLNLGRRLPDIP